MNVDNQSPKLLTVVERGSAGEPNVSLVRDMGRIVSSRKREQTSDTSRSKPVS